MEWNINLTLGSSFITPHFTLTTSAIFSASKQYLENRVCIHFSLLHDKLAHIQWVKTTSIHHFTVLEVYFFNFHVAKAKVLARFNFLLEALGMNLHFSSSGSWQNSNLVSCSRMMKLLISLVVVDDKHVEEGKGMVFIIQKLPIFLPWLVPLSLSLSSESFFSQRHFLLIPL